MAWTLLWKLSLFALFMGVATVFVIPSTVEPWCWLAIFLISAWALCRRRRQGLFAHGLVLGLLNSIWMTACHVLLFNAYVARHPAEMQSMAAFPIALAPRLMMAVTGPNIGLLSGIVIGLITLLVGLAVKSVPAQA